MSRTESTRDKAAEAEKELGKDSDRKDAERQRGTSQNG